MPIWGVGDPVSGYVTRLQFWHIYEVPDTDKRFLNGWVDELQEGRISTPIVEFDAEALMARTRSGRMYQLVGPSGHHPDAFYVLQVWCRRLEIEVGFLIDVSDRFVPRVDE